MLQLLSMTANASFLYMNYNRVKADVNYFIIEVQQGKKYNPLLL